MRMISPCHSPEVQVNNIRFLLKPSGKDRPPPLSPIPRTGVSLETLIPLEELATRSPLGREAFACFILRVAESHTRYVFGRGMSTVVPLTKTKVSLQKKTTPLAIPPQKYRPLSPSGHSEARA